LDRLKQVADCLNVDLKGLFKEAKKDEIQIFGLLKVNEDIQIVDSFASLEQVYNKVKSLKEKQPE